MGYVLIAYIIGFLCVFWYMFVDGDYKASFLVDVILVVTTTKLEWKLNSRCMYFKLLLV